MDIRKFFGGGAPSTAQKPNNDVSNELSKDSNQKPPKSEHTDKKDNQSSNSSKKKSYEEIDLNDSDDESLDNKPFRSRLKPSKATKKKETKDVKPNEDIKTITIEDSESNDDDVAALKPSAVAATKRPIVEIESDSSGKVSESIETNTKRAKMSETTEPDAGEKIEILKRSTLKVLDSKVIESSILGDAKKRKELVGGVDAFFGGSNQNESVPTKNTKQHASQISDHTDMEISQNYVPNPQEEFQSPKKKARYVDESKNHPNQQADNATDLETPNADDGDTAYRSPTSKNKTPTKATKASPKKKAVTPKTHAADSGPKGIDGSKFVITENMENPMIRMESHESSMSNKGGRYYQPKEWGSHIYCYEARFPRNCSLLVGAKAPKKKSTSPCYVVNVVGVLGTMTREDTEDYILSRGGKVMSSVSGKTDYLVAGYILEDGRQVTEGTKYRTAKEKGVTILTEEQLLSLGEGCAKPKADIKSDPVKEPMKYIESETTINRPVPTISKPSVSTKPAFNKSVCADDDLMWVDKYRPTNVQEIIGSGDIVKKLCDWLSKWDTVHIQKSMKIPFSKENAGAKIALLSGPPGIGKSTMATICAKYCNFEVLEFNASDKRSKKSVGEALRDIVTSTAIRSDGNAQHTSSKRVIIMDEVDGMSGNADRGGIQELLSIAKISKNPIICICNDRQSPNIRSLANSAFDLKVKRPTKSQIASRMVSLAIKEGLKIDQNAAELLVEQSGNDIRQVINALQMWQYANPHTATSNSVISYINMKEGLGRIEKDKILRQTPFEACLSILAGPGHLGSLPSGSAASTTVNTSIDDRYQSFFIDDIAKMERLSRASDAVSDVELLESGMRGDDQHWELLPAQAGLCVRVGSIVRGFQAFPAFPAWLGKNSTMRKVQRLTKEIVHHTSHSIDQNFASVRLEYIPYLRSHLLNLMNSGDDPNIIVTKIISILDDYGLSRDDFMETFKETQFILEKDPFFTDRFEGIDSKLKAALTRAYNSGEHMSQALVAAQGMKKKSGRSKAANDDEYDEDDDEGDQDEAKDEENEEDFDISKFAKKSKSNAKSSSSSSSKAAATSSSSSSKGTSSSSSKGSKKK